MRDYLRAGMALVIGAIVLLEATAGWAQSSAAAGAAPQTLTQRLGVAVFPSKGQSETQQQIDENNCFAWAKTNSGIDPFALPSQVAAAQPQPAQNSAAAAGQGKVVKGTAGGAAGGAAIGAIAGDAGKGAAIGATVGVLQGARARRQAEKQAQAQQQQAQSAAAAQTQEQLAQQRATYNKSFSVCMEGKGYAVK